MNALFNTEIKVHFENDTDIQTDECLNDMFVVSREIEKLVGKEKNCFLLVTQKKTH